MKLGKLGTFGTQESICDAEPLHPPPKHEHTLVGQVL